MLGDSLGSPAMLPRKKGNKLSLFVRKLSQLSKELPESPLWSKFAINFFYFQVMGETVLLCFENTTSTSWSEKDTYFLGLGLHTVVDGHFCWDHRISSHIFQTNLMDNDKPWSLRPQMVQPHVHRCQLQSHHWHCWSPQWWNPPVFELKFNNSIENSFSFFSKLLNILEVCFLFLIQWKLRWMSRFTWRHRKNVTIYFFLWCFSVSK